MQRQPLRCGTYTTDAGPGQARFCGLIINWPKKVRFTATANTGTLTPAADVGLCLQVSAVSKNTVVAAVSASTSVVNVSGSTEPVAPSGDHNLHLSFNFFRTDTVSGLYAIFSAILQQGQCHACRLNLHDRITYLSFNLSAPMPFL